MLELKNITKDYPASGNTVHALRGVSLQFRTSEFVLTAILRATL